MKHLLRHHLRIAILFGVLALAVAPAAALATQPAEPGNGHGKSKGPHYTPTPPGQEGTRPAQAKAYGFYCQGDSKTHTAGTPGTPFSACIHAMKEAATHEGMSPGQACKATSGKHVKGVKGTPHSICVAGVVKMRKEQREATT